MTDSEKTDCYVETVIRVNILKGLTTPTKRANQPTDGRPFIISCFKGGCFVNHFRCLIINHAHLILGTFDFDFTQFDRYFKKGLMSILIRVEIIHIFRVLVFT